MEFRSEFNPKAFSQKINHQDKLLLVGSCFTENIGSKLRRHKFNVLENPNGILFNPVSIVKSISSYIDNKIYTEEELFYQNECWNSWEHHTRFSHPDKNECLELINRSQQAAHHFIKAADWILITLGSAFLYQLCSAGSLSGNESEVVANCHKVPTDKFKRRLLNDKEIVASFSKMLEKIYAFNSGVKIIFTISPVRHLRDGFIENNRSKAALIQAVHQLVDADKRLFYFPAYELVIDDLRDYRFYAEDMVHPNYAATGYVWDKFITACIGEQAKELMKEINSINAAKNHKPFHPASAQHKQFLQDALQKTLLLKNQYPYLDIEEEINYFKT